MIIVFVLLLVLAMPMLAGCSLFGQNDNNSYISEPITYTKRDVSYPYTVQNYYLGYSTNMVIFFTMSNNTNNNITIYSSNYNLLVNSNEHILTSVYFGVVETSSRETSTTLNAKSEKYVNIIFTLDRNFDYHGKQWQIKCEDKVIATGNFDSSFIWE